MGCEGSCAGTEPQARLHSRRHIVCVSILGGQPECSLLAKAPNLGTIRIQGFSSLSYCAYLRAKGHPCDQVPIEPTRNRSELSAFLRVKEVNAVVVDDYLRQFYEDSSSAVLREFEDAPQQFGFEARLETEGGLLGKAALYVRSGSAD